MKKFIIILILFISTNAFALTDYQKEVLRLAHKEGKKIGYPETLQGLALTESSAGLNKYGDKRKSWIRRSYGVTNIQLATAKWFVKKKFNHKLFQSDRQLRHSLIHNDRFNLMLTRAYFEYLLKMFNGNWKKAVLAFNVGPGNVKKYGLRHDPNGYVDKVWRHINKIARPFNKKEKLV